MTSPHDPVLSIRNLEVSLAQSGTSVLDGISFDVAAGEIVCVVGESGSGKSVTSLATMGLLPANALTATAGEIVLAGENLLHASADRLRSLRATTMAMIFQEPMTALNPVMRIGKQIDEVLNLHSGMRRSQRHAKVVEMLEEVGLPDVERIAASYPHQLSGGQRQRVMIAMALILRPKLLIADEPTTALDVTTQKQIIGLIQELRERNGTAVIFITHDMGVVAEIADRVVVMKSGKVVETGKVEDVLRRPAEAYTRALLRAVPSLVPRAPRSHGDVPPVLQASGLGKTYFSRSVFAKAREVDAARDVNLALQASRTIGIVGESGSGKSTVARCIMRLIDPTAGSIRLADVSIEALGRRQLKPYRRKIQVIFQDPNRSLNPRITVGDAIIEGPTNYGVPRAEAWANARRLLETVGLPGDAIYRFPHQFSGGQRQRIAIARALAVEPEVIVADEAVSALDVSVQQQVLALLAEIQVKLKVGILFITHDLRVAAQICDEIMVMKSGRVVEHGPTSEVLVNPRSDYTRSLIEAAPARGWDFANCKPIPGGPEMWERGARAPSLPQPA